MIIKICNDNKKLSKKKLSGLIASSLQKRELMLKIISVDLYDMEENSRFELLVSFKQVCKATVESFKAVIEKFCPEMNPEEREKIGLAFFAYLHGIYPYAYATDYQMKAMNQAGMKYESLTISDMVKLYFENIFREN